MSLSKLVDGKIPAHTVCPFKEECTYAASGVCGHQGTEHAKNYSCGAARAYNLCYNRTILKQTL